MQIAELFEPVNLLTYEEKEYFQHDSLRSNIKIYSEPNKFPSDVDLDIVIIGVNEFRGSAFRSKQQNVADLIRKKLYALKKHNHFCRIADIGNFVPGHTVEDTYFALGSLITELVEKNIFPIIIGGSQDLTYAQYRAYENLEQVINIVGVDSRFDLGGPDDSMNSKTWLGKIVLKQPNYLFNYSNIGHQTYFVGQEQVQLIERLFFDAYRLGQVRSDIQEVEPIVRGADILTFDMSSIRSGDSPACFNPSPNGFYGEEACQIMMYAGLSDKLSGLGIYEYDPSKDKNEQSAELISQMIWYFIEGFTNRKRDLPVLNEQSFMVYRVPVSGNKQEIIFLKSNQTERWWMELPSDKSKNRMMRQHFLPCSYKDYEQACNNEIPDRWWQALQKMN
jgi:arginase family enzyme